MSKKNVPDGFIGDLLFNPEHDSHPVDQVGFVDLRKAFTDGTVPGDLMVDESRYNGVDDPASLVGRNTDVFDAIRKATGVRAAESAAAAAEAAAASSAEN